jgi:hypothetical protein
VDLPCFDNNNTNNNEFYAFGGNKKLILYKAAILVHFRIITMKKVQSVLPKGKLGVASRKENNIFMGLCLGFFLFSN